MEKGEKRMSQCIKCGMIIENRTEARTHIKSKHPELIPILTDNNAYTANNKEEVNRNE